MLVENELIGCGIIRAIDLRVVLQSERESSDEKGHEGQMQVFLRGLLLEIGFQLNEARDIGLLKVGKMGDGGVRLFHLQSHLMADTDERQLFIPLISSYRRLKLRLRLR